MNVALFSDCYYPAKNGVSTYTREIKDGLTARGHNVFVVAPSYPSASEAADSHDPKVLRLFSVPLGLGTDHRVSLARRNAVSSFIKQNNVQIIHTQTEFYIGKMGVGIAEKLGLPVVHTFHTLWEDYSHYLKKVFPLPELWLKKVSRKYIKTYLAKTDLVLCPSAKSYDYVTALRKELRVQVLPNAINRARVLSLKPSEAERNLLRESLGIEKNDKVLVFVGRLSAEKKVLELLNQITYTLKKNKDFKLLFVGGGPDANKLKDAVTQDMLEKQVLFTGAVQWERVIKLCYASDVFVTISRSEILPMTVIEALVCGLPIIAPEDKSFSTMVEDNVNGYLLKNDETIGDLVSTVLLDPKLRLKFKEASLRKSEEFSIENHILKLEDLYYSLLRG